MDSIFILLGSIMIFRSPEIINHILEIKNKELKYQDKISVFHVEYKRRK